MNKFYQLSAMLLMGLCMTTTVSAANGSMNSSADVADIQKQWALVQYRTPEKEKADAFEKLAEQAAAVSSRYPDRAEPLIWEGIVLSTRAGTVNPLKALKLVSQSREKLEAAMKIDPAALQGSAYTSLGTLYYMVPGWPLSFGDKDKAGELLREALKINPNGIDPNYFYADYLRATGKDQQAADYLERARQAPAREGRELADEGRHAEIEALKQKLRD